jgi:hypothetical protein
MSSVAEILVPALGKRLRDPDNELHVKRDLQLLKAGILDPESFESGYRFVQNPVELIIRNVEGKLKAIRRTKNLQTTMGRDQWKRLCMAGDSTAYSSGYTGVTGTATSAPTATTLTNTAAAFPTTTSGVGNAGLQGHVVYCPVAGVRGVIMSNTATVLTVDQWTSMTSGSGAAGTTPANGAVYVISHGGSPALWAGLSTDTTTPAAGDVLRTADGLFATGGTTGTATEQNANGLVRAYIQPTFSAGEYILGSYTWTYTGSSTVNLNKVVLCNSIAAAGSLLFLESLLSAQGTVNANGDTISLTWTITLN